MSAQLPGIAAFGTIESLGGRQLSLGRIERELRKIALDGVLGVASCLDATLFQNPGFATNPTAHAPYWEAARRHHLRRCSRARESRRVQTAPTPQEVAIHAQALTYLVHLALLNSPSDISTPELTPDLIDRVTWIQIQAGGAIPTGATPGSDLRARRKVAVESLRLHQFHQFQGGLVEAISVALRQRELHARHLAGAAPEVRQWFRDATTVELEEYFSILIMLACHAGIELKPGTHFLGLRTFAQHIRPNPEAVSRVVSSFSTSPLNYRESVREYASSEPPLRASSPSIRAPLLATPLIDIDGERMAYASVSTLMQKLRDGPLFAVERIGSAQKAEFTRSLGSSYEAWAIERLRQLPSVVSGHTQLIESPRDKNGNEVCDAVLLRDDLGIVFEFKALRWFLSFLDGRSDDNVVGPSEDVLRDISQKTLADLRSQDDAALTRGLWQIASAEPRLINWLELRGLTRPTRLCPCVVVREEFVPDVVATRVYLHPLVDQTGFFPAPEWTPPLWIGFDDLERLGWAERQFDQDAASLLVAKQDQQPDVPLNHYILETLGTLELDAKWRASAKKELEKIRDQYFPPGYKTWAARVPRVAKRLYRAVADLFWKAKNVFASR